MQVTMQHKSDPSRFRLTLDSDESAVRAALAEVRRVLDGGGVAAGDRGTIELVLGEVLNNVVEHAYGPGATGVITLKCRAVPDGMGFCVCDNGRSMPGLRLPEGRLPDLACHPEDLPEGGFGWFLVRRLATDLKYARRQGTNIFRFRVPYGQG